jgi:hypothetical protein
VKTDEQFENIVRHLDTARGRERALTPFGPLNPASTTLRVQEIFRENQEARLMELLNSLESVVETLVYKSFTAYDTLNTAIEDLRAALSVFIEGTGGTDE